MNLFYPVPDTSHRFYAIFVFARVSLVYTSFFCVYCHFVFLIFIIVSICFIFMQIYDIM